MRLNRNTILLALVGLIVIVAVLLINNTPASAPDETPTPSGEVSGPLFEGVDAAAITRLEVRDNWTRARTVLVKDEGGSWAIEATYSTDRATDQTLAAEKPGLVSALQSVDRFESADLASFGLANPAYTVALTGADGVSTLLHIGDRNPAGNRYYTVLETTSDPLPEIDLTEEAASESTAAVDATPEPIVTLEPVVTLEGAQTIYLVAQTSLTGLIDLINQPPYVPAPTATPTPTNTPNPFSEVEMTATAQAVFESLDATATAQAAVEAAAEVTAEATAEPTPAS